MCVDDFTHYSWVFPLALISQVCSTFLQFQSFDENQLDTKIKRVQFDWGGEFCPLVSHFTHYGIGFQYSCPYTHQQNGWIECKHRQVTEVARCLLAYAFLPLSFWWDVVQTVVFLIN